MLLIPDCKFNSVCNVNVNKSCTLRCHNPIYFIAAVIPDNADNPAVEAADGMIDPHNKRTFDRGVELFSPLDLTVVKLIGKALFIAVRMDRMSHLDANIFSKHVLNSSTVYRMYTDLPQTQQNTLFFRPHSIYRNIIHSFCLNYNRKIEIIENVCGISEASP